jgi:hypothetical protein
MNSRWPPDLAWALGHGPVVAALAAFAISPGAHILIAATLERRPLRVSREFAAVAIGDPLLACAVGIGVALSPHAISGPARPVINGTGAILIAGGWLGFGLWQWWDEVHRGYFSVAQALAPTKIWHQLGVYPMLGSLACCSTLNGLTAPLGSPGASRLFGKSAIVLLVLAWAGTNYYDRRHPKLGHPPYSWRYLRPVAKPWPGDSETLRSNHDGSAARHLAK